MRTGQHHRTETLLTGMNAALTELVVLAPAVLAQEERPFQTPFLAPAHMACWEDRVLVDKKIVQLSKVANNGIILISCISVCYNKYPALIFCQTTWGNKV